MSIWTFSDEQQHRFVPLAGANNFRDLGGWLTTSGKSVRRHRLFRSGVLSGLTHADHETLSLLKFADVVDLRSDDERENHPTLWPVEADHRLWADAGEGAQGDLMRILAGADASAASITSAMEQLYARLPTTLIAPLDDILHALAEDRGPLLFHCSAGKDRTGVASAILLKVLDVRPGHIRLDYLLTNHSYLETQRRLATTYGIADLETRAPGATKALFGAHDALLRIAFQTIDEHYGSFERYLRRELAIGGPEKRLLEQILLS